MSQLAADQYWFLPAKISAFSSLSPGCPVELDYMGPHKQVVLGVQEYSCRGV